MILKKLSSHPSQNLSHHLVSKSAPHYSILPYVLLHVIFILLVSNAVWALPEDRKEIIELSADCADLNQKTHQGTYTGNVTLNQGTTHLRAANAMTEGSAKNQLIKAIAQGNQQLQAHYWTLPEKNKPIFHAYADNIHYYALAHKIKLIGNARITQGDNSFSAPKIIYDIDKQHILTEIQGTNRTTITFYPEKKT